jgi:hypothetical protein
MTGSVTILSIDAWGNQEDGYEWNSWHKVGSIPLELWEDEENPLRGEALLAYLVEHGFLTQVEGGELEDDGRNWVVKDKSTGEPLFAIDYGAIYN